MSQGELEQCVIETFEPSGIVREETHMGYSHTILHRDCPICGSYDTDLTLLAFTKQLPYCERAMACEDCGMENDCRKCDLFEFSMLYQLMSEEERDNI